jgi:hypothetical protein
MLIRGARDSRLGSVKRVIYYLRQPGPQDHAFACTHAALNRLTPEDLPADLSGKALFIDEAHHASADGLSQIVTLWRERGGQLFFFTATPYRGDGRPVRLDRMRAFRRSLAEHMDDGFAPRHLESEIVALGQPGDVITAGQFTGEEAPPQSYFDDLVTAICRRWLEDGKPKAIVRVPPMRGGRSGELVSRLSQALTSHGARVLDATGTSTADKQRFLTALDADKNRTHSFCCLVASLVNPSIVSVSLHRYHVADSFLATLSGAGPLNGDGSSTNILLLSLDPQQWTTPLSYSTQFKELIGTQLFD